ncbi:MAG TPA: hypothetical protein VG651_24810 [Stellaceae bacterium]|nr:hypothetical protein [Stellaceae bacterium]
MSIQLVYPGPEEAMLCLRAMRSAVARADGVPPASRALMEAAKTAILKVDADIDTLPAITPPELAAGLRTPGLAEQFVQAMLINVLADGMPDAECMSRVEAFAAALGITPPALRTTRLLCEQHMVLFRLDFMRRSHIKDIFVDQYRHHGGIRGLAAGVLGLRGLHADPELAKRYAALGDLSADTFGYAYFHHCRDHGFAFPGEPNGFPEAGAYHDMSHVLSGYGTKPEEEMLVAAFQAGFKRLNPFYVILFVVFSFSTGVNVTPVEQPHITGLLAEPGLAARFIRAVERGSQVNTDLSSGWDYWPVLELPLAEARRHLNVVPERD